MTRLHILALCLTGTFQLIAQAPTSVENGLFCRDSIAESKVIQLHQKAELCDSVASECVNIINEKNSIIEDNQRTIEAHENHDVEQNKLIEKLERKRSTSKLKLLVTNFGTLFLCVLLL